MLKLLLIPTTDVPKTVPILMRWTVPSGEVLEVQNHWSLKAGMAWWWMAIMPSYEGKVQKPTGTWQIEFLLDSVSVAKMTFTLAP